METGRHHAKGRRTYPSQGEWCRPFPVPVPGVEPGATGKLRKAWRAVHGLVARPVAGRTVVQLFITGHRRMHVPLRQASISCGGASYRARSSRYAVKATATRNTPFAFAPVDVMTLPVLPDTSQVTATRSWNHIVPPSTSMTGSREIS